MFSLTALDPRTKMLMIAAISTAAMTVEKISFLLGLFVFTSLLLALGKVNLGRQIRQVRTAVGMVIFLFLLQTIFGQMMLGAVLCIRLLIIILSALILLTGEARDYLLGLIQLRIPYEIAYMVLIGLHFFPILKEEALDVYYSVQLRGTEIKKTSLRKKLKIYLNISLPVLAGAMERAKDTSIAMEARAFRAYPKRTYMRKLKLKARDIFCIVIFPLLAAGFILTGCSDGGEAVRQTDAEKPSAQIVLSQTAEPETSQAVSWYGANTYDGAVRYGTDGFELEAAAEREEVRPDEYYRYKAVLKDLKPGTTYQYQVGDGKTWSETGSFTTASDGETSFLYMGDIQYQVRDRDYQKWGTLLRQVYRQNPQIRFGVLSGDMVEKNGDMEDWSIFFEQSEPVFSRIPLASVPGNHETSILPYTYLQMMAVPENGPLSGEFYCFEYGNCRFLMLNSCLFMEERIRDMGEEKWNKEVERVERWIAKELSKSGADWKIAVMHHPPYPIDEDDEIYSRIRESWLPVLEAGGTDLVLCGHQHAYMRTEEKNGITYIMGNSGQKESYYYQEGQKLPDYVEKLEAKTGTYQIVTATGDQLKVEAFDEKGKRFDVWKKD